ncbi:YbaB/EbfC DNA-binding family protein [Micromonospora sediminicola]|uniref:YbaB/EbfC DNA-binding family protein n=2 Tax=Micromonosporaceae TaxID=28056 RepID=A0A1A9BH53_9ACTN|nr:YbaB/EbfC DNA-binding family protein [Micromonospora sediminicola]
MDEMLTETLRALAAHQSVDGGSGAPLPEGAGEAADGLVRVRTAPPGRVTAMEVDPRLLRLDLTTLIAHIMAAVNDAMADLQRTVTTTAGPVDLAGLSEQLTTIQQDAARQFTSFLDGLAYAQERLSRRGG